MTWLVEKVQYYRLVAGSKQILVVLPIAIANIRIPVVAEAAFAGEQAYDLPYKVVGQVENCLEFKDSCMHALSFRPQFAVIGQTWPKRHIVILE